MGRIKAWLDEHSVEVALFWWMLLVLMAVAAMAGSVVHS